MFTTWTERTVNPCWCHFIQVLYNVALDSVAEEAVTDIVTLPVAEAVQSLKTDVQEEFMLAKIENVQVKVCHLQIERFKQHKIA